MSRLYTMVLAAITLDLLDTPSASLHLWIRDPEAHGVVALGITESPCIPIGSARERDVLHGAVWRATANGFGSLSHVYALTAWTAEPLLDGPLRVLTVNPDLAGLLAAWPIAAATNWSWGRLSPQEASDVVLRVAQYNV